MTTDDEILRLMRSGESQTLEFKESLSVGLQAAGIQSLVAFANRDGGQVLFGVADDGSLRGASVGANTIENLANLITARTYPSLVPHIEVIDIAGRNVVLVETVGDRPPVIGIYMYSGKDIPLDEEVEADGLRALRRVGRTNQTSDIMWLRPDMPSDPKLRLIVEPPDGPGQLPPSMSAIVWIEQPSASAHFIELSTEPPLYTIEYYVFDLPFPLKEGDGTTFRIETGSPVELTLAPNAEQIQLEDDRFAFVAKYRDDSGLRWEVRRDIYVIPETGGTNLYPAEFERRICDFPPKKSVD